MDVVEVILHNSLSGDNSLIAKSYDSLEKLKETPSELVLVLFDIFCSHPTQSLRVQAGFTLLYILSQVWNAIEDELKKSLHEKLMNIMISDYDPIITNPLANLICYVSENLNIDISQTFFDIPESNQKISFLAAVLWGQTDEKNLDQLVGYVEQIYQFVLHELQSPIWSVRLFGMNTIARYIEFFPCDVLPFEAHSDILLSYAKESITYPSTIFSLFWEHMADIFAAQPTDLIVIEKFAPVIIDAVKCPNYSPTVRITCLRCFLTSFMDLPDDLVYTIFRLSVELAVEHTRVTQDLPFSVLILPTLITESLDMTNIFPILEQEYRQLILSEDYTEVTVGFTIVVDLINIVTHMMDVPTLVERIVATLQSDNELAKASACAVLACLDTGFPWELIIPHSLLELVMQQFTSESTALRMYAMQAATHIVQKADLPFYDAVGLVMSQASNIRMTELTDFARLLMAAIANSLHIHIEPLLHFSIGLMQSDHLEAKAAGAMITEAICNHYRHVSTPDVVTMGLETLDQCATTQEMDATLFLLARLKVFASNYPDKCNRYLEKYVEQIRASLNSPNIVIRRHTVIKLSKICGRLGNHPLLETILPPMSEWARSSDAGDIVTALKCFVAISPNGEYSAAIAETLSRIRNGSLVVIAINALEKVTRQSQDKRIGIQAALMYIEGAMEFEQSVPPATTDLEYQQFFAFQQFFRCLLTEPNDATLPILEFESAMFERTYPLTRSAILDTWSTAIISGVVPDLAFFSTILAELLNGEICAEMYNGINSLIFALYITGGLSHEELLSILPQTFDIMKKCLSAQILPPVVKFVLTFLKLATESAIPDDFPLDPHDIQLMAQAVTMNRKKWRTLPDAFDHEYAVAPARFLLVDERIYGLLQADTIEHLVAVMKIRIQIPEVEALVKTWMAQDPVRHDKLQILFQ